MGPEEIAPAHLLALGVAALSILLNLVLFLLAWRQQASARESAAGMAEQLEQIRNQRQELESAAAAARMHLDQVRQVAHTVTQQVALARSLQRERELALLRKEQTRVERDFDHVISRLGELIFESSTQSWLPRQEVQKLLTLRVKSVFDAMTMLDDPWRTTLANELNLRLRKTEFESERRRKTIVEGLIEFTKQMRAYAVDEIVKAEQAAAQE